MSEEGIRRRTGATFADVWPSAPTTSQDVAIENSAPNVQIDAPRELGAALGPTAVERRIARRDQRISTETVEGKLLGHGTARYRFQPTEAPSYYARLLTSGGVITLWGRGLAQAIAQSTTQVHVGDRVAFRRLDQDLQSRRVQWRAEKPEWFAARDKAARQRRDEQLAAHRAAHEDPELARALLPMKAAQALAERRLTDPVQRLKFIAAVAARSEQTARQGRLVPTPTLRSQPKDRRPIDARQKPHRREPDRTR